MTRAGERDRLFVYGTLREGFESAGRRILEDGGSFVAKGEVRGALYDTGSFPVLVVEGEGMAVGEVYRLDRPEAVLERLDRYEGAGGQGSFQRRLVSVRVDGEDHVEAWAYVWEGSVEGFDPVPGDDFGPYVGMGD